MRYVTPEVAEKIRFCVERLKSGDSGSCPCHYGLKDFCDDPCPDCWRKSCIDYIREHAPQDKVVGAEYVLIRDVFSTKAGTLMTLIGTACLPGQLEYYLLKFDGQLFNAEKESIRRVSHLLPEEKKEEKTLEIQDNCIILNGKKVEFRDMEVLLTRALTNESRFATREAAEGAIKEVVKPFLAEHPDFEW